MKNNSTESARKRQGLFLLCLPLILFPVFGLLVWNSQPANASEDQEVQGLNLDIPQPLLEKRKVSKAAAYQAALQEGKKSEEWIMPDFLSQPLTENTSEKAKIHPSLTLVSSPDPNFKAYSQPEATEKEVSQRIRELKSLIDEHEDVLETIEIQESREEPLYQGPDPEIILLQQMMGKFQKGNAQPDPEIQQLDRLMDKILQLQNPESMMAPEIVSKPEFIPVPVSQGGKKSGNDSEKKEAKDQKLISNGFFGLDREESSIDNLEPNFQKTYSASIASTQEILPGQALNLVIEEPITIGDKLLPIGTSIYGKTKLQGSRLQIEVSGILQDGLLIPVSLLAYSQDGIPGIELSDIKGASHWIQATGQSAQSLNMNMMGMDWQTQLANSGIQATRSLIQSKSRLKKIEIKAGHPVLLIDFSSSKTQTL